MKLLALILLSFAALVLGGCASAASKINVLPDGSYKSVNAVVTGKFSSTSFAGTNVTVLNGELQAGKIHLRHSNAWVPLIDIEMEK